MQYHVRWLTSEDLASAWELGRIAFGSDRQPPVAWTAEWKAQRGWGVFSDAGRLVAQALDREQGHWFGGRVVPASGVSGLVVVPELRGTGRARQLLTRLLVEARDRGAVISTLFDTTPGPYRSLGWEEVGVLAWTALPTSALAGIRRPEHIELRPAVAADVPALLSTYRAVARASTGFMERSGPLFVTTPDAVLAGHDGITVARGSGGRIEGYATWDRGCGHDTASRLSVPDLIGMTEPATRALLAMLGSWAGVVQTLLLRLPDPDPTFLIASAASTRIESRQPWMLRVVDAYGAIAARGWPPHLTGSVDIVLEDDVCPWNGGPHRLVLADGAGRLESGGRAEVQLTMRGFALLYAGTAGPALLRRAGLMSGGDERTDTFLQAATAGPAPAILDSF